MHYKKLNPQTPNPQPAKPGDAGYDLYAMIDRPVTVYPNQTVKIPSGLAFHIDDPHLVGLVLPRSGSGMRGLILGNTTGVIDSQYTGEIVVQVWNRSDEKPYEINPGDRIAQLLLVPVQHPALEEVDSLAETTRGMAGFGSTGA